jgi:hypothetical protein
MTKGKKAYIVDIDLVIRVIADEDLDPNIDYKDFDKMIFEKFKSRLDEEGSSFITEGITDIEEDEDCPYDPEYDD